MEIPTEEASWALALAVSLRHRLLTVLLAIESMIGFAVQWLWTAKVPLPGLIGVPALIYAAIHFPAYLVSYVDALEVLGQGLASLETFIRLLPRMLHELLLTERLVDSPFLLWAGRFWMGFFRGLWAFWVQGRSARQNGRRGGGGGGGGDDAAGDDAGAGISRSRSSAYRQPYAESVSDLGSDSDAGNSSDDGSDRGAHEPLMQRDPSPERAGQGPHTITQELHFWVAYYQGAALVLTLITAILAVIYFFCNFLVSLDSWCGTSVLCGGPNGAGDYACLRYNDAVVREAISASKAPLKYRFFYDGTRIQFPRT
ncbi:hypothetical protein NPX13_g4941 [Xylaria arbuscula]|uniref:Uncharacterized protein n=1 Tax=Xylaria arbuscula TaxID=114810 RepID=A0A9W8NEJ9_9PEZI|nr:hypothetical protein NPX13_g4941 [Xylaria arbuscula]